MPAGTIILGTGSSVSIATTTLSMGVYTPGTYNVISDLNRIDDGDTRGSTNIAVYGRSASYNIPGARTMTKTFAGLKSQGDTGQDAVNAAYISQAVVSIKVMYDATNGFTQLGRISGVRKSNAVDGAWEYGFDFAPIADEAAIP